MITVTSVHVLGYFCYPRNTFTKSQLCYDDDDDDGSMTYKNM